jgi:hypothetical protein
MKHRRVGWLVLLGVLVGSCKPRPGPDADSKARADSIGDSPVSARARRSTASDAGRGSLDLIEQVARCDVHPGGVFVDLGSPAAHGVTGWWSLSADPLLTDMERDGETWARVLGRKLVWRFVLDEAAPLFVSMRARGAAVRSAVVSLDARPLGTLSLGRGQGRVSSTHVTPGPVGAGAHVIELRFAGQGRSQTEPAAEIDWVRVARSEEGGTFAPPTMGQIVSNAALGGVPHRAVALRAPSSLRCPLLLPAEARLELSLGFEGPGRGEAEVLLWRDGEAPVSLYADQAEGGDHALWKPAKIALPDLAGKVATIELRARSSTAGGRLILADPLILST